MFVRADNNDIGASAAEVRACKPAVGANKLLGQVQSYACIPVLRCPLLRKVGTS
jgi:hypothetical protein